MQRRRSITHCDYHVSLLRPVHRTLASNRHMDFLNAAFTKAYNRQCLEHCWISLLALCSLRVVLHFSS